MEVDAQRVHDQRWWTLVVLCLSLMIIIVGNSSMNLAIPTFARELNASTAQLQWVVAGYSLVFASLLLSAGAIGDRFGRKGALQAGLAVFLACVLVAAWSQAMWQIVILRCVMGAAAAFIMPSTLSILVNVFDADERPKAIAIWASVTGAASVFGPIGSGFVLDHYWWGSVFLINAPLILLALIGGHFVVPRSRDPQLARLDFVGALLSTAGLVALVYGLIEAPARGWTSAMTLGAFVAGALVLLAFGFWEHRCTRPMLDLAYFRNPAFALGTSAMAVLFFLLVGCFFLFTQYFQLVAGYRPLAAGIRLFPLAVVLMAVSPITPRLTRRFGARTLVVSGLVCIAMGLIVFRGLDIDSPYIRAFVGLVFLAAGQGLAVPVVTTLIMSAVPSRRAGAGSAMNNTTRELGAALGVAVLGSTLNSSYVGRIDKLVIALSPADRTHARVSLAGALDVGSKLPQEAQDRLVLGAKQAFVSGLHLAMSVGIAVALATAMAFVLFRSPKTVPQHVADETIDDLV